jgi:hypothetical protein
MITCKLICYNDSIHLAQIFTGFFLLHRKGRIVLSQECATIGDHGQELGSDVPALQFTHSTYRGLLVILNGTIRLYYDTSDGSHLEHDIAKKVDYYFKRSYLSERVPQSLADKIFPLGLNYPSYPDGIDPFQQQRRTLFEQHTSIFLRARLAITDCRPTWNEIYAEPNLSQSPKILFMTRAWDPCLLSPGDKEKYGELNEKRAQCILRLRQEFGNRFLGGFTPKVYALRHYRQVTPLRNFWRSLQKNYLKLLPLYPICVATTGLHRSIGFKLGEYVAFSKAIVSEKLNAEIPGDFIQGQNYFEFDTPEQCVEAVSRLCADKALRLAMIKKNHEYYLNYLRPDVLVERTLRMALSGVRTSA